MFSFTQKVLRRRPRNLYHQSLSDFKNFHLPEYNQVIGLPIVKELPGVPQVVGDVLDRSQQSHIHLVVLTLGTGDNINIA